MGTFAINRTGSSVIVTINGIAGDAELVTSALIEILAGIEVWVTTPFRQYVLNPASDTITINGASFIGTAAQLQTKLSGEVYQSTASSKSDIQKVIAAFGGSLIGETAGLNIKTAVTGLALSSGALRMEPMVANESKVCTGLRFNIGTPGVYTPNNFNGAALCTIVGGVNTQIAISADTPNIWASAAGYIDLPFVTPVAVTEGTVYTALWLYSSSAQTTAPAIRATTLGATATAAYPGVSNSAKLTATLGAQTAIPASVNMSAFSISGSSYWCAMY